MNTTIARIEQLDRQMVALRKIIDQGDYEFAGISLSLQVGPRSERKSVVSSLEMELTESLPHLLGVMLESLGQQVALNRSLALAELKELEVFFNKTK